MGKIKPWVKERAQHTKITRIVNSPFCLLLPLIRALIKEVWKTFFLIILYMFPKYGLGHILLPSHLIYFFLTESLFVLLP